MDCVSTLLTMYNQAPIRYSRLHLTSILEFQAHVHTLDCVWMDLNLQTIPPCLPLLQVSNLGAHTYGLYRPLFGHLRILYNEQRQLVNQRSRYCGCQELGHHDRGWK
jgi:hypothetical protein